MEFTTVKDIISFLYNKYLSGTLEEFEAALDVFNCKNSAHQRAIEQLLISIKNKHIYNENKLSLIGKFLLNSSGKIKYRSMVYMFLIYMEKDPSKIDNFIGSEANNAVDELANFIMYLGKSGSEKLKADAIEAYEHAIRATNYSTLNNPAHLNLIPDVDPMIAKGIEYKIMKENQ